MQVTLRPPTLLLLLLAFLSAGTASAQSREKIDQTAAEILREGLALYQSERASWVGTDLLQASGADMSQVGGYVSYPIGTDSMRCVFFRKPAANAALQIFYGYDFPCDTITMATGRVFAGRNATVTEQRLFTIWQRAREEMVSHKKLGTPYQRPAGTNLNVALLDKGSEVRVYVLTGPKTDRLLPFGNDYLLTFSATGELQQAEKLHQSYLPMTPPEGERKVVGTMHSHLEAHPYITPSDICTVLLYQEVVPSETLYVMSKDFVSLFNVPKQQLVILTKKAWDKINRSQSKQNSSD
ncbi:hypothetical protein [Hymenobacter psychrophilus]|uniref:Uncharacterized protein n=1 Tax=Hymenobacter psychrophilus TaxID=651662 RepID=A0A1H3BUI6_9BACT|nr:hypothetical protein [Hymenobacter psychrophilus]SDX45690.1 hypothetical protein SAMN04488069_101432 [Hymenobacter psychrophilus]